MAVSRALRRLLRIRILEEEQARLAMEAVLGELHTLEHALAATSQRDRRGRRLVEASVQTGELPDRVAGAEETRTADRFSLALRPQIVEAAQDVTLLREGGAAPGRDADRRLRSARCSRRRPAQPAGARRLVPQSAAPSRRGCRAIAARRFHDLKISHYLGCGDLLFCSCYIP